MSHPPIGSLHPTADLLRLHEVLPDGTEIWESILCFVAENDLDRYLGEFEYRWNHREQEDKMWAKVLKRLCTKGELPYEKLTKANGGCPEATIKWSILDRTS